MVVSLKHGLRSSVRRLALDAGLPISTAYRYLHEGFTVLAQQHPTCTMSSSVLEPKAGHTSISTERSSRPTASARRNPTPTTTCGTRENTPNRAAPVQQFPYSIGNHCRNICFIALGGRSHVPRHGFDDVGHVVLHPAKHSRSACRAGLRHTISRPVPYVAVNPPSWTLCSELLFYLLFPFIFGLVQRIPARQLWLWAAIMVGGVLAIALITQFLIPDTPKSAITPVSTMQLWFGYIFPVPRLFEFVLGSILARLVLEGVRVRLNLPLALVLCLAGYGLANVVPFTFSFTAAMIVPLALLIMVAAGRDADGKQTVLASRPMQWLGDTSFGFYLCQGVTIFYARIAMGNGTYSTPVAIAVVVGLFFLTLGGGWALHSLVEMPAMRRWARKKTAEPHPVSLPV